MTTQTPLTLPDLLSNLAEMHGDEVALVYEGEKLTFTQLEDRSSRLARGLAELGIESGDKVAVWLPNTFACVELEFALARLGAVAVAINTMYRAHEVQDILARSGARMLVLWPGFKDIDFLSIVADLDAEQIPGLETLILLESGQSTLTGTSLAGRRMVSYRDVLAQQRLEANSGWPEAPCIAFTSSGTTSAPKLILHSQGGSLRTLGPWPERSPTATPTAWSSACYRFVASSGLTR